MEILYTCCCGIDVHAANVVACLIKGNHKTIHTFSTMTSDLLRLRDWLVAEGCQKVAMESTGVYWKPVFNILETELEVILVNARHLKTVPGRKTDVKDCQWIAECLQLGLLKASFIPPRHIRELRELTRYRDSLVKERTALSNRIIKLSESANIKLAEVASDALGVSGKLMLRALAAGETDAEKMSHLARRSLKRKQPQLRLALEGRLTAAQRWVLGELLDRYDEIDRAVGKVESRIDAEVKNSPDPFVAEAIELLDSIPGVGKTAAQTLVAEIGVEMSQFPDARHLASWAGMCPGNHESAGKRKQERITKGSKYLRAMLVQSAWAATSKKTTYFAAQYRRLVKRKGKKKALVAVGHSLLVVVYCVLTRRESYQEVGGDYFERRQREGEKRQLVRRLEALGLRVTIEELGQVA